MGERWEDSRWGGEGLWKCRRRILVGLGRLGCLTQRNYRIYSCRLEKRVATRPLTRPASPPDTSLHPPLLEPNSPLISLEDWNNEEERWKPQNVQIEGCVISESRFCWGKFKVTTVHTPFLHPYFIVNFCLLILLNLFDSTVRN